MNEVLYLTIGKLIIAVAKETTKFLLVLLLTNAGISYTAR